VAGMMHRYWGDGVPGYAEFTNYEPDDVYSRFVMQAMDLFDQQLHRLLRDVQSHPGTVLVIASSMGQGPIEYLDMRQTYVLDAPTRLVDTLGLDRAEVGLAMYPRTSLRFDTADRASEAAAVLGQITTSSGAMFHDIRAIGTTTSFEINYARGRVDDLDRSAYIVTARGRESVPVEQLGIAIRERIGGGNTAYHIPEGIFIAVGDDLPSVRSRPRVDVLDVAPFLLSLLDVQPAPTMQGVADRMRGALMASASS